MPMLLPRAASLAACSAVNGGATTISTLRTVLQQRAQLLDVEDGLLHRLEHLPVAGDEWAVAYELSVPVTSASSKKLSASRRSATAFELVTVN